MMKLLLLLQPLMPLILVEMILPACRMAHSFEQQATPRSKANTTPQVTLVPALSMMMMMMMMMMMQMTPEQQLLGLQTLLLSPPISVM